MNLSVVRLHEHNQVFNVFGDTQDISTVSRSLFDMDVLRIFLLKAMWKQARSRNVSKRCPPARTQSSFDDFECTQDIFTVSPSLFDTDVLRIFMLKTMCKQARSRNVS